MVFDESERLDGNISRYARMETRYSVVLLYNSCRNNRAADAYRIPFGQADASRYTRRRIETVYAEKGQESAGRENKMVPPPFFRNTLESARHHAPQVENGDEPYRYNRLYTTHSRLARNERHHGGISRYVLQRCDKLFVKNLRFGRRSGRTDTGTHQKV